MKYLLLRDNKQTGPYSAEELAAKGLKAYDLVWAEGKSAAWRYPSEIDELKPFAPVVEEQPYDRFYKKPGEQTAETTVSAQAVAEKKQPVQETREVVTAKTEQPVTGKHIYVTMPGSKGQTTTTTTTPVAKKEEKTQKEQYTTPSYNTTSATSEKKAAAASSYIVSKEDDELNSSMLAGYQTRKKEDDEISNGYLSDYEQRKAAFDAQKSGSTVTKKTEPVVAATSTTVKKEKEPSWQSQSRKTEKTDLKSILAGSGRYLQDNKNLTRVLVAAVLILGGVVIGLVINSGHHQPDTQALESLVKEMREQQNGKSNTTPKDIAEETTQKSSRRRDEANRNDNSNNMTEQEQNPSNSRASANRDQSIARHAVLKKDLNTTPPVNTNSRSIAQPVSNTNNEPAEPIQAVVENKEKSVLTQEMLDKARHNLYDLVHAEASEYKVGLLGGISDLDITVTNNSLYALDQVAVEIKYFGPEKKLVKSQTLVFSNVPSGKRRTLEAPRTNRGIKIDYSIISINSKALGLAQAGN